MGIVNITPDSFSDGGQHLQADAAIARGKKMLAQGADILDLGAESTRPGAQIVSAEEELRRLQPVIEGLLPTGAVISVDTRKAQVMEAVLSAKVAMINDIEALVQPEKLALVAKSKAAVCLMHMQGTPQTMQQAPRYDDVVSEVLMFLRQAAARAKCAGISPQRLVVDPGFGFGKSREHNLELLRQLRRFTVVAPVLVGLSRKSVLGKIIGQDDPQARLSASVTAALLAVQNGASLVRVHDVAATRDALKVFDAVDTVEPSANE